MALIGSWYDSNKTRHNIKDYYNPELLAFFQTIQGILSAEGLVFTFLLAYLILLHIYLKKKGMTTYEYIIRQRTKTKTLENPPNIKIDPHNILSGANSNSHLQLTDRQPNNKILPRV